MTSTDLVVTIKLLQLVTNRLYLPHMFKWGVSGQHKIFSELPLISISTLASAILIASLSSEIYMLHLKTKFSICSCGLFLVKYILCMSLQGFTSFHNSDVLKCCTIQTSIYQFISFLDRRIILRPKNNTVFR